MHNDLYIGAAYYPEVWDEKEQDKDIAAMREAGLNCVRVGEFAWSSMEPREGEYAFALWHTVLDKLHAAGIAVVLCTPTCTPPKWLTDKHPETLRVLSNGTRKRFGARCHTCKSSPLMREYGNKIVTKMCEELASHPAVIGWQIDNELYPYDGGCYCEHCCKAFRNYLAEKYGDIQVLNKQWGTARWSLTFASFEEIEPPRKEDWNHPSSVAEWKAFCSRNIVEFAAQQAEIIRRYSNKPVGTDSMPLTEVHYGELSRAMDIMQFNHYDAHNDIWRSCFWYDYLRTLKDSPFWVTETQAGWCGSNYAAGGYRPAGNCYINSWLPFAFGGQMNLYWLFREHAQGHELAHGALVTSAGRFTHTVQEVQRVSADLKKAAEFLSRSRVANRVAMHFSGTAARIFQAAPILDGFDYVKTVQECFYKPLQRIGVDVIETDRSLDGYDVLFSPFLATMEENDLIARIRAWVHAGGTWVVGPMSDIFTPYAAKYTHAPFGVLEETAKFYTVYRIPIHNEVYRAADDKGRNIGISQCFDAFEPQEKTRSLLVYANGPLQGKSAAVACAYGKGSIVVLGTVPSGEYLRSLADKRQVPFGDNIIAVRRTGEKNGWILTETQGISARFPLDKTYRDLLTDRVYDAFVTVKPYTVYVLEEK